MGRLLFFVALGALVVWWLFGRTRRVAPKEGPAAKPAAGAEEMVACAHCGVHLPRADAVVEDTQLYCGDEHRRLGPRRP
jgi:uncharacterized protein